jgi:putative ABC transport system permease protein
VGVEVALSTILLIVGALLVMSFYHVMRVDKGFEVAHIVAQDVSFLNPKYSHGGRQRFVERAVAALAQIPGVEAAAATNRLPLEGDDWLSDLKDPDQPPRPLEQATLVNNRFVTAEFWKALGIPLKRGRYLDDSDKNQPRAVLSERAAQYLWGDEDPIGKHISGAGPTEPKLTVVGVVGEVHGTGLERPASMIIYEHYWRVQPIEMSFVVRTRGDDGSAARQMRAVLAQQDPEMALPPTKTMEQIVEQSVESRRFQMYIAAGFAAAALLLASLGIYGVIAFTVARRTTEIGIRMALGAPSLKLRAMILRQGIMPAVAGVAAGVLAATFLGRVISSQLYGVAPSDPVTIIAVAAILLTVAVCACWFPAQRAARIEPMRALRTD